MTSLILFSPILYLNGGLGNFQAMSSLCMESQAITHLNATINCESAFPFIRYNSIPLALYPVDNMSLPVTGPYGDIIYNTWGEVGSTPLMSLYEAGVTDTPTTFWFGNIVNCNEWRDTTVCASGVVWDTNRYAQLIRPESCNSLQRIVCVCKNGHTILR